MNYLSLLSYLRVTVLGFFLAVSSLASGQMLLQSVKPWIGVAIEKGKAGVMITRVFPDTPGAEVGLLPGDEVVRVQGNEVATPEQMIRTVTQFGVGVKIEIEFTRQGKIEKRNLSLVARPDADAMLSKALLHEKAPDGEFVNPHGLSKVTLAGFGKKPMLLMFWATWCPACKAILPEVIQYAGAHPEVATVLISTEEPGAMASFFKKPDASFTALTDPGGSIVAKFQVSALPTFVVTDQEHIVQFAKIGGGVYFTEATEVLKTLVGKK